jgi:hypothetical protein
MVFVVQETFGNSTSTILVEFKIALQFLGDLVHNLLVDLVAVLVSMVLELRLAELMEREPIALRQ